MHRFGLATEAEMKIFIEKKYAVDELGKPPGVCAVTAAPEAIVNYGNWRLNMKLNKSISELLQSVLTGNFMAK